MFFKIKNGLILGFAFAFILLSATDVQGQTSRRNDDYFDDSGDFASRLWYGGGLTLWFGSNNNNSAFQGGLSPMVGYKVLGDIVSVGPRVSFLFYQEKNDFQNFKQTNWGVGPFARFKVFQQFFAQTEYEAVWIKLRETRSGDEVTATDSNFYIGAGYNTGGFEVVFLYNLLEPEDSRNLPYELRFGYTFNF